MTGGRLDSDDKAIRRRPAHPGTPSRWSGLPKGSFFARRNKRSHKREALCTQIAEAYNSLAEMSERLKAADLTDRRLKSTADLRRQFLLPDLLGGTRHY